MKDSLGNPQSRSQREIKELHTMLEANHRLLCACLHKLGGEADFMNEELDKHEEIEIQPLHVGTGLAGVKIKIKPIIEIVQQ